MLLRDTLKELGFDSHVKVSGSKGLQYLDFEGVILKGQYGGGTVMVWDIGTYELIEGNYYKGFLRFYLNGTKLKGEWTLKRFAEGRDERDSRDKWHLTKTDRNTRAVSTKRNDESALTKRTMREIAAAADAVAPGDFWGKAMHL